MTVHRGGLRTGREYPSVIASSTAEVSMLHLFCGAVLIDKPAFLRGDGLPANGADDRLRFPEKHRGLPDG
jgi:hypothetical protein